MCYSYAARDRNSMIAAVATLVVVLAAATLFIDRVLRIRLIG